MTASAAGLGGALNSVFAVNARAASRLVLQTQPASTAAADVNFAAEPVVRVEDAFGNLRMGESSTVVNATRNAGTAALQGATSATAVNGLATFVSPRNSDNSTLVATARGAGSGTLQGTTTATAAGSVAIQTARTISQVAV